MEQRLLSMSMNFRNQKIVEIQNAQKSYWLGESEVRALQGVDLTIERGEFIAIWGPSGSGKTTLLNLIGIMDEATSGSVTVDGRNVMAMSDDEKALMRNRLIGYIFQSFNLIAVLSALENVMLPLEIGGHLSSREMLVRARLGLQEVGLAGFEKHRPEKLSGGQRQRVAIARALITNPLMVIADEPTANLDTETAQDIMGMMKELNQRKGVTFIFSTHDQRLLDQAGRLVLLQDGRMVEDNGRI